MPQRHLKLVIDRAFSSSGFVHFGERIETINGCGFDVNYVCSRKIAFYFQFSTLSNILCVAVGRTFTLVWKRENKKIDKKKSTKWWPSKVFGWCQHFQLCVRSLCLEFWVFLSRICSAIVCKICKNFVQRSRHNMFNYIFFLFHDLRTTNGQVKLRRFTREKKNWKTKLLFAGESPTELWNLWNVGFLECCWVLCIIWRSRRICMHEVQFFNEQRKRTGMSECSEMEPSSRYW